MLGLSKKEQSHVSHVDLTTLTDRIDCLCREWQQFNQRFQAYIQSRLPKVWQGNTERLEQLPALRTDFVV